MKWMLILTQMYVSQVPNGASTYCYDALGVCDMDINYDYVSTPHLVGTYAYDDELACLLEAKRTMEKYHTMLADCKAQ